jgi:VWFA-related protein
MRTERWPVVLGVLTLACTATTLAGTPGPSSEASAGFRAGVELVALNVVVTDARKQPVDGLGEQDFAVFEDGVRQDIALFGGGRVPLDLVLLLDASASMEPMRKDVQRAASTLVAALQPGDRAAAVAFTTSLAVLEGLTEDRAKVQSAIGRAGARGNTALFASLYVALRELAGPVRHAGEVRRLAFVIVTDGEENRSVIGLDTLLDEARSRGVAIYAVMVQSEEARLWEQVERHPRPGPAAVRQLAVETGAASYFPLRAAEIPAIATAIANELSHQYSLAYVPARGGRPLRSVAVRLIGREGLKVRTRTTWRSDTATPAMLATR